MEHIPSPTAARNLADLIEDDFADAEEEIGQTDCPEGCIVEPDGYCSHNYESAGLTLGVI